MTKNLGRPKGTTKKAIAERKQAEALVKLRISKAANALVNAQMHLALGATHLFVKKTTVNKDGKPRSSVKMVTDPEIIARYLDGEFENSEDEFYFISTEKPDNKAIDSMLDRAFGKARQSVDITSDDEPVQFIPISENILADFKQYMLEKSKQPMIEAEVTEVGDDE